MKKTFVIKSGTFITKAGQNWPLRLMTLEAVLPVHAPMSTLERAFGQKMKGGRRSEEGKASFSTKSL